MLLRIPELEVVDPLRVNWIGAHRDIQSASEWIIWPWRVMRWILDR